MKNRHRRLPVVYSSDSRGVPCLWVAVWSLVDSFRRIHSNDGTSLEITILTDGSWSKNQIEEIVKLVKGDRESIRFLEVGDYFKDSHYNDRITRPSYFRFLIPQLLPSADRVLYLDFDTLVKGDVWSVANELNNDCYAWGVRYDEQVKPEYVEKRHKSLGHDSDTYIQAGVMVINCDALRRDNLLPRIVELSKHNFEHLDQDVINLVCKGKLGRLPIKYNVIPETIYRNMLLARKEGINLSSEYEQARSNPVVIHFAGPKPWELMSPGALDWWEIYRHSPFYDPALEHSMTDLALKERHTDRFEVPDIKTAFLLLLSRIKHAMISLVRKSGIKP